VSRRPTGKLSAIENEVIPDSRAMRASPVEGLNASPLENPSHTARHFILDSHGNVQLRPTTTARELGVEIRTLERIFFDEYHQTMVDCQVETRLAYSKSLLSIFPPTKISSVAVGLATTNGIILSMSSASCLVPMRHCLNAFALIKASIAYVWSCQFHFAAVVWRPRQSSPSDGSRRRLRHHCH